MININILKTNSYCVVGRHYSGINNILRVVTSKGSKMLKVTCTKCEEK